MIRRLKRRMILLVLAGLLLASAGLVTAINWMNWNRLQLQANSVLDMLAENGGQRPDYSRFFQQDRPLGQETPPPLPTGGMWEENRPQNGGRLGLDDRQVVWNRYGVRRNADLVNAASLSNYYTITLNAEGQVCAWTSERQDLYTDEDMALVAATVLRRGKASGRVDTQFYRLTDPDGEGKQLLIVVDSRLEIQSAQGVLRLTALVAVAEDVLLSLAAVWLIRRLVQPVDEAMEKQKQFVWDASHELKTPLAVISANAEALAADTSDIKPLEYIRSEVQRTDHLIQNLLSLARMEKNGVQTSRQRFDLSRALTQVALPFESTLFETGKEMRLDIPDGIFYTGDEEMMKQLTVILLSNAEKYSDPGGVVEVALEAKGEKRVIRVHNTGPAIPAEAQARIFDRFYRVDSSHTRAIDGNGLGLAIAQSIVNAHKGKITVHSAEGEGTTFTVTL